MGGVGAVGAQEDGKQERLSLYRCTVLALTRGTFPKGPSWQEPTVCKRLSGPL